MLGWSPDILYRATLPELLASIRGWQRSRGINPDGPVRSAMTRQRLQQLMEQAG